MRLRLSTLRPRGGPGPRRTSNEERQRSSAMHRAVARKPPRMIRSDAFSCCRRAACSTRLSLCANATAVAASASELMWRRELARRRHPPARWRAEQCRSRERCGAFAEKPCGAGRHDHEKRERRRVTSGWGRHPSAAAAPGAPDGGDTRSEPPQPALLFRQFAGAAFFRPAQPGFRSERAAALEG